MPLLVRFPEYGSGRSGGQLLLFMACSEVEVAGRQNSDAVSSAAARGVGHTSRAGEGVL